MKKTKISFLALLVFTMAAVPLFAEKKIEFKDYDLDVLIHNIDEPGAPVITNDYIVFTAEPNHRYVGIAFEHENYQIVHPFKALVMTDDDGNSYRKHLFYCYERKHEFTTLKYRLVIDGLWTTDPFNPQKEYDDSVNLYFSVIEDPNSVKIFTKPEEKNGIHFIYRGKSGLKLNLAGTFTNWDPWIYQLKETSPGFYELTLPLPTGKYFYNYYIGLTPIMDESNPEKAYAPDGRSASVIIVD